MPYNISDILGDPSISCLEKPKALLSLIRYVSMLSKISKLHFSGPIILFFKIILYPIHVFILLLQKSYTL